MIGRSQKSDCLIRFGWDDFDPTRLEKKPDQCPVRGCSAGLLRAPYGDRNKPSRTMPWCPEHGIRIHANTFAYWNGLGRDEAARLRNFIVSHDRVRATALPKGMKVEAHRLGYEMSEDALSWNVFESFAMAGRLREVIQFLTGRRVGSTPRLYLWGRLIDDPDGRHELYEPLVQVRAKLEPDIRPFVTEPDIMLVAEGELVVCIEAKFGSGNPLAHESEAKEGEKPSSRAGLLKRYLGNCTSDRTKEIVCLEKIGPAPRSQLLRNVVFASEMAGEVPWHVVNLVSSTQGAGPHAKYKSYADPTEEVCAYLRPDRQHCFTFRTWESLHAAVICGDPSLSDLERYLRGKSAHFLRAFTLRNK
jgi:hypothetical protein